MSQSRLKQTAPKKKKKATRTWLTWLKRIAVVLITLFVLVTVGVVIYAANVIANSPKVTQDALVGTMPSTIYDKDGEVVTKLGSNDRILIDPSNIPQIIEDAIISIEDRRFYEHNGIDIIRIGGALFSNLTTDSTQGGSTITQQLIKLSVFSTTEAHRTIDRKIQEIHLAMQLEKEYTKKDILALYLNKTYMANNTYGFATAAKYYFDKDISELTVAQAALFAGMVQAPSTYDPLANPEAAQKRRDTVLWAMRDNKKITQEQYEEAINTPVQDGMIDRRLEKDNNELIMDAYIQQVLSEVTTRTSLDPYTQGLAIYTHLDMDAQRKLADILNTSDYIEWQDNNIQAAVTITSPKTGAIIAMIGGRNTDVQLGINRATANNRSVGSTSKPVIDYGPAIEYLNRSTGAMVSDTAINYTNGPALYNWDKKYYGNMTLRNALVQSRNTTALRVFKDVGPDNANAFLNKLGITVMNDGKNYLVESNSIGFEASTLQMSAAYAAFSNGGTYYKPFTIRQIVTQSGETASYVGEGSRAMKDSTAYMITDILKGVPGNTAPYAAISGLHHAGKTGSTNYTDDQLTIVTKGDTNTYAAPDAWYVGYSTHYSIATWVGYDNPMQEGQYVGRQESYYPSLIYKHIMSYLAEKVPNENWKMPDSVVKFGSELYVKGSSSAEAMRTSRRQTTTTESSQPDDETSSVQPTVQEENSTQPSTAQETTSTTSTTTTSN